MPLIKARTRRIRVFRHICRLQEPNRDALLGYAKFIGEPPDYVINQLIETTLARDRDFLTWRAEQGAGEVPANEPSPQTHSGGAAEPPRAR